MKPEYKAGALIGTVVLTSVVAIAAAFVYAGSRLAVYAAVGVVPALVIVGGLWVRSTSGSPMPGAGKLAKRKARSVGTAFESFWDRYETASTLVTDGIDENEFGIDRVVSRLESNGMSFDRETGTVSQRRWSPFSTPEIESLSALEDDVDELNRTLGDAVTRAVETDIERLNEELRRLGAGGDSPRTKPQDVPDVTADNRTIRDAASTLKEHREHVSGVIDERIDEVRRSATESDLETDPSIAEPLSDAESALADGALSEAITRCLDAEDGLRDAGGDRFERRKRLLSELVGAADPDRLPSGAVRNCATRIESIGDAIDGITDPAELPALRSKEDRLRSECVDLVDALETELGETLSTLDRAELPDGYYVRPPDLGREFATELRETESLPEFTDTFAEAVALLNDRLDAIGDTATIVRKYDEVADRIADELGATGKMDADDLPVREHESGFMRLYAERNPGVVFDADAGSLRRSESSETYDLSVTVTLDADVGEREVTVEIENDAYEQSMELRTADTAKVIFDAVPFGEYVVRARPRGNDLGTGVERVTVDSERVISFLLSSRPATERLCEGLDSPERILNDFDDRLSDRFERESMLDTDMDVPIDEQYVGCLLVQWADRHGLTSSIEGGHVVVYDAEQLIRELRRVAEHNLDPDEHLPFGELRDRFLTAAVPDRVIESNAAELDGVRTDGDGLIREGS